MAEAHVSSDHWLVAAGVAGPAMVRAGKGGWEAYSHPPVVVGGRTRSVGSTIPELYYLRVREGLS